MSALTPDERDALSGNELVEHDLQHVVRGPGVSSDTLRGMIRERVRRERAQKAQDGSDDALAASIGSTRADIRQARAEKAAEDAAARRRRSMAAARRGVAGAPSPRQAQTQDARDAVAARVARSRVRARELDAQGLSSAQIAARMTAERDARLLADDPKPRPINPRTVQRWLAD